MNLRPDPTFYPSAKDAMEGPVETLAFTLMLSPDGSQPDGLAVVNVDPTSDDYGKIVHSLFMPNKGDEFHHFGWNACSSALSPLTGHASLERRYLIRSVRHRGEKGTVVRVRSRQDRPGARWKRVRSGQVGTGH